MELHTPMTRPPRYAEFSIQETSTGLNEFIHVFRDLSGNLRTRTFFEKANHGGEVDSFDAVDWKEKVPDGVPLRGSNGGAGSGAIPNYWVAWQEPGTLKALSIYQENPLSLPMEPQDSLVDGPVVGLDGKLHVYFLRKAPNGYDLWEHVFMGEAKKKGQAATAKLAFIAGDPLYIRADPIARLEGFKEGEYKSEVAGIAVIGWLTRDGSGMRAHGAWLEAAGVKLFASDPIAGYAPFPNQRIGIWANPDSSRLHLAWIMGRTDSDTLRSTEWTVWAKTEVQNIRIDSRGLGGSKVHAVACVIRRTDYSPETYSYYLTKTGRLYEQERMDTRKIKEGVPLDYDFPIYASFQGPWEARVDTHGAVYFAAPSWENQ
ncbi:MAG: hypothetical protein JF616_21770 [Fibrobacteres bacterium]|nr:hypothetical protein [Fibrobacterota bacterium]